MIYSSNQGGNIGYSSSKGSKAQEVQSSKPSYRNDTRRRLSYKEKQEFQQLERDIEELTLEKSAAEEALSSGTLSVEEITKISERFQVVTQLLDEKEMRWLELSEYPYETEDKICPFS